MLFMSKDNLWLWVKTTSHYFYEIHQLGQYFYEYGRLTVYEKRRLCHFYKNYEYRRRLKYTNDCVTDFQLLPATRYDVADILQQSFVKQSKWTLTVGSDGNYLLLTLFGFCQ